MTPTVLFDVDGTLIFYRGIAREAMQRAVEEEWGIAGALDGVSFAGATDHALMSRAARGHADGEVWERYARYLRAAVARLRDPLPLPGVTALLDRLEAAGAPLGLLTGNVRDGARIKLSRTGLWPRFDLARSAFAEDGRTRPEIAAAARRRCGDGPLVVVGDARADVTAARHIGARVLLTNTGPQERAELEAARPDHIVDDLSATDDVCAWLLSRP